MHVLTTISLIVISILYIGLLIAHWKIWRMGKTKSIKSRKCCICFYVYDLCGSDHRTAFGSRWYSIGIGWDGQCLGGAALCMPLSWYIMGSGRKDYPSGRQSGETALPVWSVQESSQWFTVFVWEEWEQQKNRWSIWHWCFSLGSVLWHLWFWECCHVSIRKRVEVDERNKIANLIDWYEKDQQCHTFCFRF